MIDTTIIRAAGYEKGQHERGALGRSKGDFTTKIHAFVNASGQILRFLVMPGQRHDIFQASLLLEGIENPMLLPIKPMIQTL